MESERDEKLRESLSDVLQWVQLSAEQSKDFVIEQAPLVAQEFVAWTFWESVITAVAALLSAVLSAWCCLLCVRKCNDERDAFGGPEWTMGSMLCACTTIGLCVLFLCSSLTAVKAKVAPRVLIIEKVSTLVK